MVLFFQRPWAFFVLVISYTALSAKKVSLLNENMKVANYAVYIAKRKYRKNGILCFLNYSLNLFPVRRDI